VQSQATLRPKRDGTAMVRRSVIDQLISSLRRWLLSLFGRGEAGRVAGRLAHQGTRSASRRLQYSKSDRNEGTVKAFQSVQSQFFWDGDAERFVHQSAQDVTTQP
jgi:hypothetical protein